MVLVAAALGKGRRPRAVQATLAVTALLKAMQAAVRTASALPTTLMPTKPQEEAAVQPPSVVMGHLLRAATEALALQG